MIEKKYIDFLEKVINIWRDYEHEKIKEILKKYPHFMVLEGGYNPESVFEGAGVFAESCAFDIMPSFGSKKEPRSAAKYAGENLLMSGWIHGEKLIRDKSAVLDVPLGSGRVVLLGFPVQFRGQSFGTFKLLPGSNQIVAYITGGDGNTLLHFRWQVTHWSNDGGA